MFISQLYILSLRGDKLVFKDYRQDAPKTSDEIFFRKYKFWDGKDHQSPAGDCPPVFLERGIHFFFIESNGLLFVATSLHNISPSYVIEVLSRVIKICRDFLGVLNEESIRKNFVLVYELLDEMLDSGVVQELTSEKIRPYVFSDVIAVKPEDKPEDSLIDRIKRGEFVEKTKRSTATQQSIVASSSTRKNEIYIDVLERLNVTFNGLGNVISSEVDGSIVLKSFLSGSPELYLALNEDLVVGRGGKGGYSNHRYATVVLDSVNFHEAADYSRFEKDRVLMIHPPDGEFVLMNYRITGETPQPFRIIPGVEVQSSYKAELVVRVRADYNANSSAVNVKVQIPIPKKTTSVGVEYGVGAVGQSHDVKDRIVTWTIQKFPGNTEHVLRIRISTAVPITANTRKEIGPISMLFEVPMHNVSGVDIKSLRIEERSKSYNPQRWVRKITKANSYVCRMTQ